MRVLAFLCRKSKVMRHLPSSHDHSGAQNTVPAKMKTVSNTRCVTSDATYLRSIRVSDIRRLSGHTPMLMVLVVLVKGRLTPLLTRQSISMTIRMPQSQPGSRQTPDSTRNTRARNRTVQTRAAPMHQSRPCSHPVDVHVPRSRKVEIVHVRMTQRGEVVFRSRKRAVFVRCGERTMLLIYLGLRLAWHLHVRVASVIPRECVCKGGRGRERVRKSGRGRRS